MGEGGRVEKGERGREGGRREIEKGGRVRDGEERRRQRSE